MKPLTFNKRYIRWILEGRKTQTRRLPHEVYVDVGDVIALRSPWSRKTHGIIEVTRIYQQPIGEISQDELEKEGFQSLREFKRAWGRIYGPTNGRQIVTVIEFQLIAPVTQDSRRR